MEKQINIEVDYHQPGEGVLLGLGLGLEGVTGAGESSGTGVLGAGEGVLLGLRVELEGLFEAGDCSGSTGVLGAGDVVLLGLGVGLEGVVGAGDRSGSSGVLIAGDRSGCNGLRNDDVAGNVVEGALWLSAKFEVLLRLVSGVGL